MRWLTHEIVAVGAAHILDLPPAGLAGALAGSVLPDLVDQRLAGLARDRQKAFNRIHRGTTHWFGWWGALFFLGVMPPEAMREIPGLAPFVAGLGFGALVHAILDMLTVSGVPLAPWPGSPKISLNVCRTGGFGEYLFLAVAVALFGIMEHEALWRFMENTLPRQ